MSKVQKNDVNVSKCTCADCPSYNECARGKTEKLYCATEVGKSECEYKINGCICGQCPVYAENNLKAGAYCIHGSADEIDTKV